MGMLELPLERNYSVEGSMASKQKNEMEANMTRKYWLDQKEQSEFDAVRYLWEMYVSPWPMKADDKYNDIPYEQKMDMLQEFIRRDMRSTYDAYLRGEATKGCVSQIQEHALLLGKIKKAWQFDNATVLP